MTAMEQPVVLLVEDHQDTRQMYAQFMETDYRVLEAGSGGEAMRVLTLQRPDVLVTDLSLPDFDGFELIQRIRFDPLLQGLPIICLSGYGGFANEQRARDLGCKRLLQKPCLPDTLADTVAEVLRAPKPQRLAE